MCYRARVGSELGCRALGQIGELLRVGVMGNPVSSEENEESEGTKK